MLNIASRTYIGRGVRNAALMGALVATLLLAAFAWATGAQAQTQGERRFALGSVVASVTGLNLREQPSAENSSVVATMPINGRAIVIGGPFNDNWYWLDYSGTKGYVNGKYLVTVDQQYTPVPPETPTSPTRATDTPTKAPPATQTTAPSSTAVPTAPTTTPDAEVPTAAGVYTGLWVGQLTSGGNVRVGPGLDNKVMKTWGAGRRVILYQAMLDAKGDTWYRVSDPPEAPQYVHTSLIKKVFRVQYEGARYKGRWLNVNITQQVVTAYEDGKPVRVTLASTGTAKDPTELGVWKIYYRLPKQDMKGGNLASDDYYFLKDVPYPQYFHTSGEGFHGTYWHDNFGYPRSHGCVNLSTPMSEWLYGWAKVGTTVYVHK